MGRLLIATFFAGMGIVIASCSASSDPVQNKGPCGNGKIDPKEECDGSLLGDTTCTGLGYTGGTLTCNPTTCKLDQSTCCADQCALDDKICQGNFLAKCQLGPQGCLAYVQEKNCSTDSKICASSGGSVVCKDPGCVDQCFGAGQSQCNGTVIETCTTQDDGCHDWVPGDDCADTDQFCDNTGEAAVCKTVCTDQCTDGDTQCSGNVIQECGLVGECMGWVNSDDCSSNGEVCKVESGVAACGPSCTTNKCPTLNGETCIDNKVNTCKKQLDTCLDWEVTEDCATNGLFCKFGAGGVAACQGTCADPCPTAGQKKCNANVIQVCKAQPTCASPQWEVETTCPLGQACNASSFTCTTAPTTGEDCGTVFPVKKGLNTVNWTATTNNYLTTMPSCSVYALQGPDIVMAYVAPFTGVVDFTINKPVSTRWTTVVAGGTCGSLSQQISCVSDFTYSSMGGTFNVTSGNTYFFYLADTTNGTNPLSNPFTMNLAEIDCGTFAASGVTFSPAKGATSNSLSPKITVDFDTAVKTNIGTVTVTGNQGTNLSFALPNAAVAFTSFNKTMTITPTTPLKAGETINVNWTGMQDNTCSKPLNPANWSFTVITPPCSPGVNGMLGGSVTKNATALTILPYYVAVDTSLSGYVYLGGASDLYRAGKTGSSLQYVNSLAGLSSTHLGYAMAINGNDIFTLDSKLSGTGWVWRISTTGGASWGAEDFATVPAVNGPLDSWDATTIYEGKMFYLTSESSTTQNTEVWSASSAPGAVPTAVTLETSFPTETYCVGLAADDTNYYVACGGNDRLLRVNRTSGAVALLSNSFDLNTTASPVIAADTNNDGTADYLYFKGSLSEVYFVCNPAGATPYADKLLTYGSSTSSYGLGYDSVNKRLYAWDYGTKEVVTIQ